MTTIVADRKMGYMAADFQVTTNDGEFKIPCDTKIERLKIGGDQYLVGLAGLEGPGMYFLEWLEHGEWDEPPEPIYDICPEDEFTALLLGPDGLFVADKFCRLVPVHNRWYGCGTGSTIAWAVLEAGCGIVRAMETATRLDPLSGFGFEVKYLNGMEEDYRKDA
jgi:hypothetical protein